MRKPARTRISATGKPESGKLPDSSELRNTWWQLLSKTSFLKVGNNLVDIGQHVSEARREDDSSSKHGETREKSHHGRRLWTKSSGRNIFFCAKVLLALLFQMLSKYFNTESTWTLFLCQRPADFRSGAANPSEHQGEGERRPGVGEGFKDITKFAKVLICIFVFLYFCINLNADLG